MDVLSAKEVQDMIGVADLEIVARGYTFDRNSLDIWFENGCVVRLEYRIVGSEYSLINEVGEDMFNSNMFFNDVKRWYFSKFNPKLLKLIRTFSQYEPPLYMEKS